MSSDYQEVCMIVGDGVSRARAIDMGICPDCGDELNFGGGCPFCICGWSACG